jgi:hypothetical protein
MVRLAWTTFGMVALGLMGALGLLLVNRGGKAPPRWRTSL